MRLKKTVKVICIVLALLIIIAAAGFLIYVSQYYKADDMTIQTIHAAQSIEYDENYMVIKPSYSTQTALVFYPGGKVEHFAYYPLLDKLSQNGIMCVLVEMPFRLAVFNTNAADEIIDAHPEIERWYVGGHSLGGAMASSYASKHRDKVAGLVLLGAYIYGDYPKKKSLTIYGSRDKIVDLSKINYDENVFVIEGGNHGQFGNYGQQEGDGTATIAHEEQQDITVRYIMEFIR